MAMNHTVMIGPNTRPTLPVPRHCMANSATMTTAEIGRMYWVALGVTISSPSTADSTEIAGVMTPSPKNRQAPVMPISARALRRGLLVTPRWASTISARMPPSPRLSARITSSTYLTVTMRMSDQKNSDSTPMISRSVIGRSLNSAMLALKA